VKFTTYWIAEELADMDACLAQHQRVFKGNQLAIVGGFVKVAVAEGEEPPKGATTVAPVVKSAGMFGSPI